MSQPSYLLKHFFQLPVIPASAKHQGDIVVIPITEEPAMIAGEGSLELTNRLTSIKTL